MLLTKHVLPRFIIPGNNYAPLESFDYSVDIKFFNVFAWIQSIFTNGLPDKELVGLLSLY